MPLTTASIRSRFGLALLALAAMLIFEPPFDHAQVVGFVILTVLAVLDLVLAP